MMVKVTGAGKAQNEIGYLGNSSTPAHANKNGVKHRNLAVFSNYLPTNSEKDIIFSFNQIAKRRDTKHEVYNVVVSSNPYDINPDSPRDVQSFKDFCQRFGQKSFPGHAVYGVVQEDNTQKIMHCHLVISDVSVRNHSILNNKYPTKSNHYKLATNSLNFRTLKPRCQKMIDKWNSENHDIKFSDMARKGQSAYQQYKQAHKTISRRPTKVSMSRDINSPSFPRNLRTLAVKLVPVLEKVKQGKIVSLKQYRYLCRQNGVYTHARYARKYHRVRIKRGKNKGKYRKSYYHYTRVPTKKRYKSGRRKGQRIYRRKRVSSIDRHKLVSLTYSIKLPHRAKNRKQTTTFSSYQLSKTDPTFKFKTLRATIHDNSSARTRNRERIRQRDMTYHKQAIKSRQANYEQYKHPLMYSFSALSVSLDRIFNYEKNLSNRITRQQTSYANSVALQRASVATIRPSVASSSASISTASRANSMGSVASSTSSASVISMVEPPEKYHITDRLTNDWRRLSNNDARRGFTYWFKFTIPTYCAGRNKLGDKIFKTTKKDASLTKSDDNIFQSARDNMIKLYNNSKRDFAKVWHKGNRLLRKYVTKINEYTFSTGRFLEYNRMEYRRRHPLKFRVTNKVDILNWEDEASDIFKHVKSKLEPYLRPIYHYDNSVSASVSRSASESGSAVDARVTRANSMAQDRENSMTQQNISQAQSREDKIAPMKQSERQSFARSQSASLSVLSMNNPGLYQSITKQSQSQQLS